MLFRSDEITQGKEEFFNSLFLSFFLFPLTFLFIVMGTVEQSNNDIIDIQDRMGYVDTGPTQSAQSRNINATNNNVATSSTSHITIKEPKPLRQVIINEPTKKRGPTNAGFNYPPDKQYPPPPQQQQLPQRTLRKSSSMNTSNQHNESLHVPVSSATNNYHNDRSPIDQMYYPTTSTSTSSAPAIAPMTAPTNSGEIEKLVVHKLMEIQQLMEALKMEKEGPRPTPSKSDPSYPSYTTQQQQPPVRRRSTRKNNSTSPPENIRQQFNKSADPALYYADEYHDFPEDNPYHRHPYQQPTHYYEPYEEEEFYEYRDEPYSQRYVQPLPLPPQRYPSTRPRRKSYGEEEHHRLARKSSRGNLARHVRPPPMYDPYQQEIPHQQSNQYHPHYYQQYAHQRDSYYR